MNRHRLATRLPLKDLVANTAFLLLFAAAIAATLRRYVRAKLVPRRDELRREVAEL